jgi:hypothetical protein
MAQAAAFSAQVETPAGQAPQRTRSDLNASQATEAMHGSIAPHRPVQPEEPDGIPGQ